MTFFRFNLENWWDWCQKIAQNVCYKFARTIRFLKIEKKCMDRSLAKTTMLWINLAITFFLSGQIENGPKCLTGVLLRLAGTKDETHRIPFLSWQRLIISGILHRWHCNQHIDTSLDEPQLDETLGCLPCSKGLRVIGDGIQTQSSFGEEHPLWEAAGR